MQEKTNSEEVPTEILSSLAQLTNFLNRNQPLEEKEMEQEIVLESLNVDTVNSFNRLRQNQIKLMVEEPSSFTKGRIPLNDYEDDIYDDDDIFYDDESLNSNDYVHYENEEEEFRFSFNQQPKFSTTFKPKSFNARTQSTLKPFKETSTVYQDTPFRLQFDP